MASGFAQPYHGGATKSATPFGLSRNLLPNVGLPFELWQNIASSLDRQDFGALSSLRLVNAQMDCAVMASHPEFEDVLVSGMLRDFLREPAKNELPEELARRLRQVKAFELKEVYKAVYTRSRFVVRQPKLTEQQKKNLHDVIGACGELEYLKFEKNFVGAEDIAIRQTFGERKLLLRGSFVIKLTLAVQTVQGVSEHPLRCDTSNSAPLVRH